MNYSSALNKDQAPELAAEFARYWKSGDASRLASALGELGAAPGRLRDGLPDRGFIADSGPWLDATGSWATAARTALRMVEAARAGKGAQAWELRQQLPAQVTEAKSFTYTGLDGRKVPVLVGDGVLDRFIDAANAEHDRILGVNGLPTASTNLGTYQSNSVARMLDGDDSTYFWSDGAPAAGDAITVDLGRVRDIGSVALAMGKPGSTEDYLHQGVLEYSADGQSWQQLTAFSGKPDVTATAPAGTKARYVRARATAYQDSWLVVREFSVPTEDGAVTGGPCGRGRIRAARGIRRGPRHRLPGGPCTGGRGDAGGGARHGARRACRHRPPAGRVRGPRRHPAARHRRNLAHRRHSRRPVQPGGHGGPHGRRGAARLARRVAGTADRRHRGGSTRADTRARSRPAPGPARDSSVRVGRTHVRVRQRTGTGRLFPEWQATA